ncbi:conserved domain-containing protein [Amycolatopsis arida]|uniref:Conserved domain-containing protein n=1 Tax=Amycolatopsis arida TaxID=587909 RepID=A0A1I5QH11_9PSEU|nr:PRC and DUF2382 domain-containing protein [Amycolatopsis arida]TDX98836.1 uncharacterized protein (TIGR02271 family) [Amycolatopsis arida]SFP45417.1 conserved domain-containing protein [Amycolatopsis arida]
MTRELHAQDLVGTQVTDRDGNKIGKIGMVYLADDTHQPEWVTVKTGLFGQKESFAPLAGSRLDDEGLHVAVDKGKVTDAPRIDSDGQLSARESEELYRYYGMTMRNRSTGPGGVPRQERQDTAPGGRHRTGTQGAPPAGTQARAGGRRQPAREDERDTMVRSEERLRVGTEQEETGHVRLRKYVVTDEQQVNVPVRREEVRIEREPISEADRGRAGTAEIGEEEREVTLRAERPVVRTESVPVERVRMGTEQVTEEQTVSGQVRKERIEVDDDTRRDTRRRGRRS